MGRLGQFKRFSISSLLFCTTLCAIVFAVWVRPNIDRLRMIAIIERVGGKVTYDHRFSLPYFESVNVLDVAISSDMASELDFTELKVFPRLKSFRIIHNQPRSKWGQLSPTPLGGGNRYTVVYLATRESLQSINQRYAPATKDR